MVSVTVRSRDQVLIPDQDKFDVYSYERNLIGWGKRNSRNK